MHVPSFVPRGLEPYQKRESVARIANAAEKVRLAALAVIKAQRSLLAERPESEARARQLSNLGEDKDRWQSMSVETIITQADA